MLAFHRSSGTEGPARATLSLVLHSCDITVPSPVDGACNSDTFIWSVQLGVIGSLLHSVAIEESSKLSVCEVSMFVHGKSVAKLVGKGVVFFDVFLVCLPDGVTTNLLQLLSVLLVVDL